VNGVLLRVRPMTSAVRVDPVLAREVADAYLDGVNRRDCATVAAFAQLASETDDIFRSITRQNSPNSLRVFFTACQHPYSDADELIASVSELRTLEITTVATDRERHHPLMSNERGGEYDRFRAVHDVVGHAQLRLGFDRDGEFAAWLEQERMHSSPAGSALAGELHGQHSVRWTTGGIAEPKAILLEPSLLRRARQAGGTNEIQPLRSPLSRAVAESPRRSCLPCR